MAYQIIDLDTWPRAAHCAVFRAYAQPQYSVSFSLDVTRFRAAVRRHGWPFSLAFIYTVAACANRIEAFRYRFVDGNVVLFDRIDTSFTYLAPGETLFRVVDVPMQDSLDAYVHLAQATADAQQAYFTAPAMGNAIFQFSGLPWIPFTHISHTDSGKKDVATPLFDWGQYTEQNGKLLLPFSAQVHHSFVDGVHLGQLYQQLQADLDALR